MPTPGVPLESGPTTQAARHSAQSPPPAWSVRAFVFEGSNVLYDDTTWRRWLFRLLTSMGLHTNYACFFRVWEDEYLSDVRRGEERFEVAFRRLMAAVGLRPAQIQEVEIAAFPRRKQLEHSARPLPGVLATLERLVAAGADVAVLSDCTLSSGELRSKLARIGLDPMVKHCRSSVDLKCTKPSATCYDTILGDLGLEAHDVAFCGHRHDDLAGAAACGMRTAAFNWEPDAEAEWFLPHFKDLIAACRPQLRRAA